MVTENKGHSADKEGRQEGHHSTKFVVPGDEQRITNRQFDGNEVTRHKEIYYQVQITL
jgi:hypothetical protein